MASSLLLAALPFGVSLLQTQEVRLDIFFKGELIGEKVVQHRQTKIDGVFANYTLVKTQITRYAGAFKPMVSQYESWVAEDGDPIKVRYSLGVLGEAREIEATYKNDRIVIRSSGRTPSVEFEPQVREIPLEGKRQIYGSVLDPFVSPGKPVQRSNIAITYVNDPLSEPVSAPVQYKGRATAFVGGKEVKGHEFWVMSGDRWAQKVIQGEDGRPLRIETADGLVMLPSKKGP